MWKRTSRFESFQLVSPPQLGHPSELPQTPNQPLCEVPSQRLELSVSTGVDNVFLGSAIPQSFPFQNIRTLTPSDQEKFNDKINDNVLNAKTFMVSEEVAHTSNQLLCEVPSQMLEQSVSTEVNNANLESTVAHSFSSQNVRSLTPTEQEKCIDRKDDNILNAMAFMLSGEVTEILPRNAANKDSLGSNAQCYKNCTILEGTARVGLKEWGILYKNGKLESRYYPFYIRQLIKKGINNVCLIVFKHVKYLKKCSSIILFALCKHNNYGCKRFKIVISTNSRVVHVYSSSIDYAHRTFLTGQVRGIERDILKKNLANKNPFSLKKEMLLSVSEILLSKGKNLQNVKSDDTVRKIKLESMTELDFDRDDVVDIIRMQAELPEFVKEVTIPFTVKLYSEEQLDVLKLQKSADGLPLVHFDATGNIVRCPREIKKKRIYFYTAVIRLTSAKRIFPIFSMISACHDANTIFKLLSDFRYFCEEHRSWPPLSGVVTDFSFANIHAICKAFNRCTLQEYLEKCYQLSVNGKRFCGSDMIGIYLCCAHFVKMICRDVDSLCKDHTEKNFFKDLMAKAILINRMDVFDAFVSNIYIILKSQSYSNQVRDAVQAMNHLNDNHLRNEIMGSIVDSKINETTLDVTKSIFTDSLRNSSPFFKRFTTIADSIILLDYKATTPNLWYN